MKRYQSLLGAGLVFTTSTGCSAMSQMPGDPANALVSITYRWGYDDHGTGFLIQNLETDSCLVVTTAHVTWNHQDVRLTTEQDGRLHQAESVRQFPDVDLALVSFAPESGICTYPVLEMSTGKVQIEDEVRVVGYPERSPDADLVAETHRGYVIAVSDVPQAYGYGIAYDAKTWSGMSGAPVLDKAGKVIAIHGMTDDGMTQLERQGLATLTDEAEPNAAVAEYRASERNWGISAQLFAKDVAQLPTLAEAIGKRQATAVELIASARTANASGSPESALELLVEAETLDANNAELWYAKGEAFYNLQQYDEALAAFDQAIAIKPEHGEAWFKRGNTLIKLERYDEAISSYDQATAIDPDDINAWFNRGNALGELERYDEAISSFEQVTRINPNDADAWYGRGVSMFRLERYDEAIKSFDQATAIDPDDADAWFLRGVALGKLERYDEAISSYDKATAINPDDAAAWYNRGIAMARLERYDEAISSYEKATKINPNYVDAWYNLGVTLDNLERYDEAITSYNKAIEINPNLAQIWINKGVALALSGRMSEALTAANEALNIEPNNTNAQKLQQVIQQEL